MKIKNLACASCGAPLPVSEDANEVTCPYCAATMLVDRGEGYTVLKSAEKVSQAVQDVGGQTQAAIRDGAYVTQAELKRLQLGQDLSAAQMQLANLQSEIRALRRRKQDRRTKQELRELESQEKALLNRIRNLQTTLASPADQPQRTQLSAQPSYTQTAAPGQKDWLTTFLLCSLLGWLGAHRFYTGHTLIGIVQLLTMGGFFLWWFNDLFLIFTGRYRDSHGSGLRDPNQVLGHGCLFALIAFLVVLFFGAAAVGGVGSESGSGVVVFIALVAAGIAFAVGYRRQRKRERPSS